MFASVSSIRLSFCQDWRADLSRICASVLHPQMELCGTFCELCAQPWPTFHGGYSTGHGPRPMKQSLDALLMEIIHSGNTWQLPDEVQNGFKPNLKTEVLYEPSQPMLWTKRQLSPSDCSARVGSAEFPNPQEEYFSFLKKTAPSPGVKVVLPSTTNLTPPFLKIVFQQWKATVLTSEKGLLHKQNLTYTNLIYWCFLKPVLFTDRWSLFIPPVLSTPLFWSFRDTWKQKLYSSLEVQGHGFSM